MKMIIKTRIKEKQLISFPGTKPTFIYFCLSQQMKDICRERKHNSCAVLQPEPLLECLQQQSGTLLKTRKGQVEMVVVVLAVVVEVAAVAAQN